jgi:hypothetical protein
MSQSAQKRSESGYLRAQVGQASGLAWSTPFASGDNELDLLDVRPVDLERPELRF